MKIIDSHIHVLSLHNQHILKWHGDHPLHKQCRLEEYVGSTEIEIEGVIPIEFDPKVDINTLQGCQGAIEEYLYFSRIITGTLSPEEGSNNYKNMVKVLIPQAPVPKGRDFLQKFVDKMSQQGSFDHVKGFRYLVQDKPKHTMTQPDFIDGLRWLDENNYVFDWGIDLRCGGEWQFEETIEVFRQVPNLKYIINHLTKPSYKPEDLPKWKQYMTEIYTLSPNSYMKLSGGFSELPPDISDDLDQCVELIFPWFKVSFDLWGVERTIWASNWPVCAINGGPDLVSKWFKITEMLFDRIQLPQTEREKIYCSNYKKAYNVTE